MQPDFHAITEYLSGTYRRGDVFEIRGLTKYGFKTLVGYFNDFVAAANAVVNNDNEGMAGFYSTINTVNPDLLARFNNRMADARAGNFTKDAEVPFRNAVFIDIDPKRDAGISATEEEHQAAIRHAYVIDEAMQTFYGFPPACIIDSGNGAHLRWRTEVLPNDQDSLMLVKGFLSFTRELFAVPGLDLDKGNFNASRIARLPATIARKGENVPSLGRVYRMSSVLRPGDAFAPLVSRGMLSSLSRLPQVNGKHLTIPIMKTRDVQAYKRMNDAALRRLDDWVPYLLGDLAYRSGEGFRIDSDTLGRPLEEAISISPKGIKDFGVHDMGDATEGYRTPVQLLAELRTNGDIRAAAELLSLTLNIPATEFGEAPISDFVMPAALTGGEPIKYNLESMFVQGMADAEYEPTEWLINGLIPLQQYCMLHAQPKVGKSTMARQMAVAVAMGLPFMDREVTQGEVVYISYEENEARWRDGIKDAYDWMAKHEGITPTEADYRMLFDRVKLVIHTSKRKQFQTQAAEAVQFPRGVDGINEIKAWVEKHSDTRLVVMDPYEAVFEDVFTKDIKKQHRYEGDLIKSIYREANCSIVVIDHSKKEVLRSDPLYIDVLNSTSGTAQKPATADMIISLSALPTVPTNEMFPGIPKGTKLAYMRVSGRYIGEMTLKTEFVGPLGWLDLGEDFPMPAMKELQEGASGRGAKPMDPALLNKILTVLSKEGATSIKALSQVLNSEYQRVLRAAKKLVDMGQIAVDKTFKEHTYYVPLNGHKLLDIL